MGETFKIDHQGYLSEWEMVVRVYRDSVKLYGVGHIVRADMRKLAFGNTRPNQPTKSLRFEASSPPHSIMVLGWGGDGL